MNYTGTIEQILIKLKFNDLDKTKKYDLEIKELEWNRYVKDN